MATSQQLVIDAMARAMAEETNGGDFHDDRYYTEEHRDLWRRRVRAALKAFKDLPLMIRLAGCEGMDRALATNSPSRTDIVMAVHTAIVEKALGE